MLLLLRLTGRLCCCCVLAARPADAASNGLTGLPINDSAPIISFHSPANYFQVCHNLLPASQGAASSRVPCHESMSLSNNELFNESKLLMAVCAAH